MEIILHFPNIKDFEKGLAKKVAELHAEAILDYLEQLDCPAEQKLALLNSVLKQVQRDANSS